MVIGGLARNFYELLLLERFNIEAQVSHPNGCLSAARIAGHFPKTHGPKPACPRSHVRVKIDISPDSRVDVLAGKLPVVIPGQQGKIGRGNFQGGHSGPVALGIGSMAGRAILIEHFPSRNRRSDLDRHLA